MRRTMVIAVREFRAAVGTRTFAAGLIIMPVMGSAGLIAAMLFSDQVNLADKTFAVIDQTGALFDDLSAAAEKYNRNEVFARNGDASGGNAQIKPRFVLECAGPDGKSIDALRAELSDRVRAGTIAGIIEIPADALDPPAETGDPAALGRIAYYANNPMYRDFVDWAQRTINEMMRARRIATANLPADRVEWATRRLPVEEKPLYARAESGAIVPGRENAHYVSIAAGAGLSLLLFLVILIGAIPLTYSVLEEKMQRSAEVLLGSVTPFQFMMGKMLGMVGVSLSIVTIYIVVGFFVAWAYGYGHSLPHHLINWFLLYQAGAILMYGSMFAAIGAACNDMKDAQNLMTPASLITCIPLFVIHPVMLEPNSTFSTLISFFPPATPMVMLLRQGSPSPVPAWQPIVGLVLVLLTALLCVALAARVFRVGILMQGKGANVREFLQWAFHGVGHRPPRPERRITKSNDRALASLDHSGGTV